MNLIQESFQRLFPKKDFPHQTYLEYNQRLSHFNANIRLHRNIIRVHLNLQWKDIDDEIKIGLIQSLLLKLFKDRKQTKNMELYNNFVRNIPLIIPKTELNPVLEASFERINSTFFNDALEKPNLIWGQPSFRKLASYNFNNDTITVSTLFKDVKTPIIDFLMYHELLHKNHQFKSKNGRNSYHSRAFREDEQRYPNHEGIETEIGTIIKTTKRPAQKRNFWNLLE